VETETISEEAEASEEETEEVSEVVTETVSEEAEASEEETEEVSEEETELKGWMAKLPFGWAVAGALGLGSITLLVFCWQNREKKANQDPTSLRVEAAAGFALESSDAAPLDESRVMRVDLHEQIGDEELKEQEFVELQAEAMGVLAAVNGATIVLDKPLPVALQGAFPEQAKMFYLPGTEEYTKPEAKLLHAVKPCPIFLMSKEDEEVRADVQVIVLQSSKASIALLQRFPKLQCVIVFDEGNVDSEWCETQKIHVANVPHGSADATKTLILQALSTVEVDWELV